MNTRKKISLAAMMAILVAGGYGGYTIIKEKELEGLRSGQVVLYEVARVIDGDTFELSDGDLVRLLGIDAPEAGECFYEESKKALQQLVEGREVELRKDVTNADDFGRLLRYAILRSTSPAKDNILVDESMVRGGYAIPQSNPRDRLYYGLLLETREQAMKSGQGLWGACEYIPSEHSQADTPAPSPECSIKGNISTGTFPKTYFLKECNNYAQVKIDQGRGEEYFCSEEKARYAGFVKAQNCP